MTTFCLDARVVQDHFPGIGRYTFNLAKGLGPLLDETERLVLLCDPYAPSRHDLRTLVTDRVTVVETSAPIFSLRQHWRIPLLLRRLNVAVYHSPYFVMPARPGVPAIVTIHDLIPLRAADSLSPIRKRIFVAALGMALRASAAILAPSQATAEDLRRHSTSVALRVRAIHSAVDPSFQPQPRELVEATLAKLHLPARFVLYVGSNRPHKNLPRLVEAWARVDWRDGPLIVAGPWDPRIPAARQRAEGLRLGQRIRFIGPVSEQDLPQLYGAATLFVFPSEYEGFGFPVVEAMSCGAAVACSNADALAETAGGAAELFPPRDVGAMASVLATLLGDEKRRTDLARRGLQRAASLTWEATSRQVLSIYRKVAELTPPL
jgi:glycosyltransferase involved in cell wall biosynthesis